VEQPPGRPGEAGFIVLPHDIFFLSHSQNMVANIFALQLLNLFTFSKHALYRKFVFVTGGVDLEKLLT